MGRIGAGRKRVGKCIQAEERHRYGVGAVEQIGHRAGDGDRIAGHESVRQRRLGRGGGAGRRQ